MVTGPNGVVTNVFEIYTSLTEAGTFNFYTAQGTTATVYGAGATAGTIAATGAAIDPTPVGPVLITVNVATGTYTITPINWSVVGSSIAGGWGGDAPLTYQGDGKWSATLDMTVVGTDTNPRFVFKGNQNWSYVMKKVVGSQHSVAMESQAGEFGLTLQDIDLKYGNFIITLDLANYTYGIECVAIDEYEISFMGSSGMNGQGATNMQGYAYQYNQMLQQRAVEGSSPFYRSNISVNGNNTTTALARWEKDLVGDCSSYVIFGLVLGNEGIHETGQVAFNSYLNNLPMMVQMARDINKVPVVQNNYGRGDFNAADYAYIKQMNILMAQWDVPTSNLLGAMDNGTGNWVDGYWDDALHPNTPGHTELFYAMVPSLFDALEAEKPQPVLSTNTYITPDPVTGGGQLTFTPDNMIHPFTVSFDVQTTGNGHLMAFNTNGTAVGNIAVTTDGFVSYTSPAGTTVTGTTAINDGAWHKVTLTHYYAWGKTFLYTDAAVSGSVTEQLEAKVFSLHGTGAPANVNYRNWFFYRSGMNELEIIAMNDNKMLKSSLELYAPMDKDAEGTPAMFANLAQSTNNIDASGFVPALGLNAEGITTFRAYPNPVKDVLTIALPYNVQAESIEVFNTLGMLVKTAKNTDNISFSALQSGIYLVKVNTGAATATIKVVKE
jgi:lysophospholipase L1-like esterase